jgi:hypothetical protein
VIRLDIKWWRFERPGWYRLYVTSRRVQPDPWSVSGARSWPVVTSNILEIEILPAGPEPSNLEATPARTLRFLDTREAAREMARRLLSANAQETAARVGSEAFECRFGLLAPHRQFVVTEMERLLEGGKDAIGRTFIDTLAFLATMLKHPLPAPPGAGEAEVRESSSEQAQRADEYRRLVALYSARAVRDSRQKDPKRLTT